MASNHMEHLVTDYGAASREAGAISSVAKYQDRADHDEAALLAAITELEAERDRLEQDRDYHKAILDDCYRWAKPGDPISTLTLDHIARLHANKRPDA